MPTYVELIGRIDVTQDEEKHSLSELPQAYDTSLKEWIFHQAPTILPLLLPGTIHEQTLTVELLRPSVCMDKVFKVMYHDEEHILHLEFESGYDNQLKSRLLVYNAGLYHDYHLPVISIVMYPFKVTMAKSPLCVKSGCDEIVTFRFKTLPLFQLDAEDFVRQHHAVMYPLLPTMLHVHADLIDQVMQELAALYRDDEVALAQQFTWMQLMLERTGTIDDLEKEKIKRRLAMFDQLWEESPMVQRMREAMIEQYHTQFHQEGRQEGRQEGLQALRHALISVVRMRYPDLAEFAQERASHIDKLEQLELLIPQLAAAPDASSICRLLESGTAS